MIKGNTIVKKLDIRCSLTLADLKRLYLMIKEAWVECINNELDTVSSLFKNSNEFDNFKEEAKKSQNLYVKIIGANGEHYIDLTENIFTQENMPQVIETIEIYSQNEYIFNQLGKSLVHGVVIKLNFERYNTFNTSGDTTDYCYSQYIVTGGQNTWASGLSRSLGNFFNNLCIPGGLFI